MISCYPDLLRAYNGQTGRWKSEKVLFSEGGKNKQQVLFTSPLGDFIPTA